ncbi:MAG: metalloregulator ArsR/SmtB family transcription factor [Desulfatibacillaceae bacterium]|nr:metalloregulator ArsR/SmtB family transcription factor [Desulfatibacillaceae bacterium]
MEDFIKVMKALSDPNRVKMVKMLQRRTMCVCEIHEALEIAQSTASKHLKILEEAGLIASRKDGLWVNYFPADGAKNAYVASILGQLRHWLESEPEMEALMERLPGIKRENIYFKDELQGPAGFQCNGSCQKKHKTKSPSGKISGKTPKNKTDSRE